MQKKYLKPWILVQDFDEETLTEEIWDENTDVRSTFGEGEGESGDDLWD